MVPERNWIPFFSSYPSNLIKVFNLLRKDLEKRTTNIREKFNIKSRYFGYGLEGSSDRVYIYVQRKKLVVDIDIHINQIKKQKEFTFSSRNNYQGRAGWVTGWEIPCSKLGQIQEIEEIVNVMCQALTGKP